jgi:hypothetical protein
LFTSEDSANLLQYRLFDVAPLPQIIERKADGSRRTQRRAETIAAPKMS